MLKIEMKDVVSCIFYDIVVTEVSQNLEPEQKFNLVLVEQRIIEREVLLNRLVSVKIFLSLSCRCTTIARARKSI